MILSIVVEQCYQRRGFCYLLQTRIAEHHRKGARRCENVLAAHADDLLVPKGT